MGFICRSFFCVSCFVVWIFNGEIKARSEHGSDLYRDGSRTNCSRFKCDRKQSVATKHVHRSSSGIPYCFCWPLLSSRKKKPARASSTNITKREVVSCRSVFSCACWFDSFNNTLIHSR